MFLTTSAFNHLKVQQLVPCKGNVSADRRDGEINSKTKPAIMTATVDVA